MKVGEEKPLSENIQRYEGGDYLITAAIWRTGPYLQETYEIGIREKASGEFWLLQGDFNHQSVQEVGNAIAMLLGDKTQCYEPEWCLEHFK